ncbi:hypothetical protein GY45DRAFT_910341 [Cubamyces sp. BRFM 1775]|nr:hypothetical protein GY45DRAFT_910341 [Cubamyces sp. BRFM 1775]
MNPILFVHYACNSALSACNARLLATKVSSAVAPHHGSARSNRSPDRRTYVSARDFKRGAHSRLGSRDDCLQQCECLLDARGTFIFLPFACFFSFIKNNLVETAHYA